MQGFLCLDFINSQWFNSHKTFEEPLKCAKWRDSFCKKWALPEIGVSDEIINNLMALRHFLHGTAIEFVLNKSISSPKLKKLNEYMALSYDFTQIESCGQQLFLRTTSGKKNSDTILSKIAISFSEMVTGPSIDRIKICNNPDCDWIFYDESKSKTKKWCGNTCSSLVRVRKFRAKEKVER